MIRILVVDDHPLVLRGLKQALSSEPDMEVSGEAQTAYEALEIAGKGRFDIVVLDISLPDRSGLGVLDELKGRHPGLSVLILSSFPEEQFALRAFRSGASGYVTKKSAPEELVKAIRKIASGGKYVSQSLAEKLASVIAMDGGEPPHEELSSREFQIMSLIAAGKTTGEIADALCLSASTVGTYRSRILEKMKMKNNAEIVRYAVENNLV
ncbi:MAG: response regulator transcription factor [Nitrospirales bacterium]|nr:response regulator transcription factor [Nitrospirales bacterium]